MTLNCYDALLPMYAGSQCSNAVLSVLINTGIWSVMLIASPPVVPIRAQGTPAPFIFASTRPASAAGTVTM